jgi:prolyl oligopeptidase
LHGIAVDDPYRWLEDGDAPEVTAWVAAQNDHTREALDARPDRGRWHERLAALVGLPTVLGIAVRGDRLFLLERGRGADQYALVERSARDAGTPRRVLLDPASFAGDAAVAIDWFEPSHDGALIALGLSEGGTEHSTLRLLDVATGTLGDLRIPDTRASSIGWLPDGSGFFYVCYPPDDEYHRHVRFHRIGSAPADDDVVFGVDRLPTDEAWTDLAISPDGEHLLVSLSVGWARTDLHLLHRPSGEWRVVCEGIDALTSFRFDGDRLLGTTVLDAPNGRIVAAPLTSPGVEHWTTLVAERDDVVVGQPVPVGAAMLVSTSREGIDTVEHRSADGALIGTLDALGPVTVVQIEADRGLPAFVVATRFESPTTVMHWDGELLERWAPDAPAPEELPSLVVEHVHYPSLDGTSIGLFLIHRADVIPGPDVPLVLNGYGGFAISESPAWTPNVAAWCAEGGVWAIAGLRGGYEHGERWHHAGRRATKQHVFDDFHAAGDWLVDTGRASHERLAVAGGSNGGLLVGAALTQRPDLARAVWCAVPLLDMIRFPQFLIARLWTDEYGDPDVAEEFAWLMAYSPYHHVVDGTNYPAVLFTTAEGDTRVDPLHARKMAALLQYATAASPDERPVLLWQAGRAGHGVGKPASMRVAEGVDVLSFLAGELGGPTGGGR